MRKFMVIIDETPECLQAMRFAAGRAKNTGGGVIMLYVIEPEEFQQWMGVAEVMRAEAMETAEERLTARATEMKDYSGLSPEMVIREGNRHDEIVKLIDEDRKIGVLVLGAEAEEDDPGPLVTHMVTRMAGRVRVPISVVPGHLSMEEIDSVC